jgi:hypothetical protein
MADLVDPKDPRNTGIPRVVHDSPLDEATPPGDRNYEVHRNVRGEQQQRIPPQRSPMDGLFSTFLGRILTFLVVAIVFGAIVWGLAQIV